MEICQLQQFLGDAPVYIQEEQILYHSISLAEATRENGHELNGDAWVMHNCFDKVGALQGERFDGLDGNSAGGSGLAVYERELTEIVPRTKDRQRYFLAIRARDIDLDLPTLNDVEHLARIISMENDFPRTESAPLHGGGKLAQSFGI
jgi:hypothetical protein